MSIQKNKQVCIHDMMGSIYWRSFGIQPIKPGCFLCSQKVDLLKNVSPDRTRSTEAQMKNGWTWQSSWHNVHCTPTKLREETPFYLELVAIPSWHDWDKLEKPSKAEIWFPNCWDAVRESLYINLERLTFSPCKLESASESVVDLG